MQQRVRLGHVRDVAGRVNDCMNEARSSIDSNVSLHAEVPVTAILLMTHLGITLTILVLGRMCRGDRRRVDNGPFAHHQTFLSQMSVNRIEDLPSQAIGFQQMAKLEQRGCI